MSRYDELLALIEVPGDDCIIWHYAPNGRGYGRLKVAGNNRYASRVALLTVSDPPTSKHEAAHGICHNRACVNPRHLSWKTPAENQADRLRDGTDNNGEAHYGCKLSTDQVDDIRARYKGPQHWWLPKTGPTHAELAAEYGVSTKHICDIVNGKYRRIS